MARRDLYYELSPESDKDLQGIFDYTEREFGVDQAVTYVAAFDCAFEQIIENPEIGNERKEIRAGLRSLMKDKHVVFYRILSDRIRIVRILHGSRDVRNFLT